MDISNQIPKEVIDLLLVVLFSLSIGMEQHKLNPHDSEKRTFGTSRTFTFIGVFGYIMLLASPQTLIPFLVGLVILGCFLMIYYFMKISKDGKYGMTTPLLALIVFCFPLLITSNPLWVSLLFFVIVLILADIKKPLNEMTASLAREEFITLAKFLIIAGVILPLLPRENIYEWIPVSPYKIWLAVVVVSAISYLSYLLRRYVFPDAGLLLTGILGGLYSSTASTIILSKKSKENNADPQMYAGSILMATAMMYFRIFILLFIFNKSIANVSFIYFVVLFVISAGIGYFIYKKGKQSSVQNNQINLDDKNPLEFKIALVFALLYIIFSVLTQYVITNYGTAGLTTLASIVGFTDIDPFLLNLFQGKYNVAVMAVLIATMQAILSNNLLKVAYTWIFGGKGTAKWVSIGFAGIIIVNALVLLKLIFF